jgi:Putative peptidoglycan binding domain
MSDPPRGTRSESGSQRPPKSDDSPADDWRWDDIEWFEGARPPGSESGSATGADREPRTGLIPAAGDAGSQPSPLAARAAVIRRRRIAAFAVLGLLFILALVIPLVVFGGGGGGSAAEQTTPLTTAVRTATAPRTTTRPLTTTTSTATTPEKTSLRVALPQGKALRRGDRGAAVVNLQKGLAALRFATGTPDGVFGATTEAAVVDFQQSNNLQPDGIVGADTVRLLNAALAAKGVTE